MTFETIVFLNHLMLYLSTIGFGLALHNALIGISNIKNLRDMTLIEVKAHKWVGRTAVVIFYLLSILCIIFGVFPKFEENEIEDFFYPTVFWHTFLGGVIAFVLFTTKFYIARYQKDFIYKNGKYIGPIFGLGGWFSAYYTSNIDFYFWVNPELGIPAPYLIPNFVLSFLISAFIGLCMFTFVKYYKLKKYGKTQGKEKIHGVAMILHGITFGYEGSAKELIGTPVLYKYVFPKTYEFLVRYAEKVIGLNIEELKQHNLNEAMEISMKKFAEIGMAEKIKIEWISENEFSVESVNCSTSVVRSYMKKDELTNSICPWGILAATITYSLTGKDIEISPSEFNEIGAKSKLKIVEKKN